jgi:hypothetical protein
MLVMLPVSHNESAVHPRNAHVPARHQNNALSCSIAINILLAITTATAAQVGDQTGYLPLSCIALCYRPLQLNT